MAKITGTPARAPVANDPGATVPEPARATSQAQPGHASGGRPSGASSDGLCRARAPLGGVPTAPLSCLQTVGTDALLVEVAAHLANARIRVVTVCDAAGRTMGFVTRSVLLRHLGHRPADFFSTRVTEVMDRDVAACGGAARGGVAAPRRAWQPLPKVPARRAGAGRRSLRR